MAVFIGSQRVCQESDFRRSGAIQEKVRFRVHEKVSVETI